MSTSLYTREEETSDLDIPVKTKRRRPLVGRWCPFLGQTFDSVLSVCFRSLSRYFSLGALVDNSGCTRISTLCAGLFEEKKKRNPKTGNSDFLMPYDVPYTVLLSFYLLSFVYSTYVKVYTDTRRPICFTFPFKPVDVTRVIRTSLLRVQGILVVSKKDRE